MFRPLQFRSGAMLLVVMTVASCGSGTSNGSCSPADCAGCCNGHACIAGTAAGACGVNGNACSVCSGTDQCSGGSCASASGCSAANCGGCCNGQRCEQGISSASCGANGASCVACTGNAFCRAGLCAAGDPSGTNSSSLVEDLHGPTYIDFDSGNLVGGPHGSYSGLPVFDVGFDANSFNFIAQSTNGYGAITTQVVDLGMMPLAAVTDAPASGYLNTAAAVIGHSYVVKCQEGKYARMYADHWVNDTSGATHGVFIKWTYQPDGSTHFSP